LSDDKKCGHLSKNAADLVDLPAALLNELEQAFVRFDIGAVKRAIEAIGAHHPSKTDALGAMGYNPGPPIQSDAADDPHRLQWNRPGHKRRVKK
jgi:hypothetical protein